MDTVTSEATKPITTDSQTLPFQGLSGSIVSSASDTRCTFSNDFVFFVLKEKNCDENRFIKSNLCRQHLVR